MSFPTDLSKDVTYLSLSVNELRCLRTLLKLDYIARVYVSIADAATKSLSAQESTREVLETNAVYNLLDTPLALVEKAASLRGAEDVKVPVTPETFDILLDTSRSDAIRTLPQSRETDSPNERIIREQVEQFQGGLNAKFEEAAQKFGADSESTPSLRATADLLTKAKNDTGYLN